MQKYTAITSKVKVKYINFKVAIKQDIIQAIKTEYTQIKKQKVTTRSCKSKKALHYSMVT